MYLFLAAFLAAALDWGAVRRGLSKRGYFTKPAVMLLLIAGVWIEFGNSFVGEARPVGWFVLGLAFSLIGDVLLMLPRERFLGGLMAFLAAHVAYLGGFLADNFPPEVLWPALLLGLFVFVVAVRIYLRIAAGLRESGQEKLRIPVGIYTLALSAMTFAALSRLFLYEWGLFPSYLVSVGALLFLISDLMLAWNRFIAPVARARLKVRITYHLGQFGLIVGAVLHYQQFIGA